MVKNSNLVTVVVDETASVMYVKIVGAEIYASKPIDGDDSVILNRDHFDAVVGLQMIDCLDMTRDRWMDHFNTGEIPKVIFDAVYDYLPKKD